MVSTGIERVDARAGGLEPAGSYLVVGAPGPAKMVAAYHFLDAGLKAGEACALLSNADEQDTLGVARAWGFDFASAWRDGTLILLGFKDDFELRALRTVEPEEVLEELGTIVPADVMRVVVDPGSMFLQGGARSLLGASFLKWARNHPATVYTTFSVDGPATTLPSSADWLAHATTGRIIIEWRSEELYQIEVVKAVPDADDRVESISVQLKPGEGLVEPEGWPARRDRDRPGVNERRLLMISLGGAHEADVQTWAQGAFDAEVVSEPFAAVARVQGDPTFGGVLVHAPRARIKEAVQACRAIRPLTRAAIVFASDDAIRSTDRIGILEAGADDCLSGGIDFRELDLRIRQAIADGSRPVPADLNGAAEHAPPSGGLVPHDRFVDELTRRAGDPVQRFFCVLDVSSPSIPRNRLEEMLAAQVRDDDGDLVTGSDGRCSVLLQGAREGQLVPFVDRLKSRIESASEGGSVSIEVLSHPADSDRILEILGISGGER